MRSLIAGLVLLVGGLLVPVATTAWWLEHDVVSTSGYVDTVTPLATDPAVVAEVEQRLVAETMRTVTSARVVERTDAALDSGLLPPSVVRQLRGAQGSTEAQVSALVTKAVREVVSDAAFVEVWRDANRGAHRDLVRALSGRAGAVTVRSDATVDVRLTSLSGAVKRELTRSGVPFASSLPRVEASFPVGDVRDLQRARAAYAALDTYGPVLPAATVVLLVLGLVVARRRRRALAWTSLLALLGVGATYVALLVGREVYLARVPRSVSSGSAEAFFDVLTDGLRRDLLWVGAGAAVLLVLALVVRRPGRRHEADLEPWD